MNIQKHFAYTYHLDVTVAQIGVSKWNWIYTENDNEEAAKQIMQENRFDVLPIKNNSGIFIEYYSTQKFNDYSSLNRLKIKDENTIYYRLSLKDLVRKFHETEDLFFFLTDYDEILGLVSYVNLNCHLVYNYLFSIISNMERQVSNLLKLHLDSTELIKQFVQSGNDEIHQLAIRFLEKEVNNHDLDFFEHLYLSSLSFVIKKNINKLPEDLRILGSYSKKFGVGNVYNLLRNKVMHPVRPILSDKESISQIHELLEDYSELQNIWSNHRIA